MMTADQKEYYRTQLQRRLHELIDGDANAEGSADTVELDQAKVGRLSRMDALQMQSMAKESRRRRQIELQRINAAIQRIADDSFGSCCGCEEQIAPARLNVDPSVPLCIECASAK